MSKKKKPVPPADLCAISLAPIREWAADHRGAIQQLAEEVATASGKPCNRHMIGRWLREDNPVQPSHGYALHMQAAFEKLSGYDVAE